MKLFHLNRESRKRISSFDPNETTGGTPAAEEAVQETVAEVSQEMIQETAPGRRCVGGCEAVLRTDVGLVRANNQDTLIEGERLVGVADGMGGHLGGEIASAQTRDGLIAALRGEEPGAERLKEAVSRVNRDVYMYSLADESLRGMGTTLTALWIGAEEMLVAHVGDSRCYLRRGGELRQITEDHSMVMEMVRAGALTPEQAAVHPMRNVITRAIGTESEVRTDVIAMPREAGDLWLICSDGLYGMMEEEDIRQILTEEEDNLERAADRLMQTAMAGGGRDNASLVLLLDKEGRA